MSQDERWIGLVDVPSIADESWLAPVGSPTLTESSTSSSWTTTNLAELDEKPPVEPTLGGLGFVYPGKRHVFSGPQESAKTLIAYAVALQVIRTGGKVLLIDFEMGPWDTRNRLRELGATNDELAMILYVEPETPATPDTMGPLIALEPQLVLIDAAAGAYDIQGLEDNSRKDVERFAGLYVRGFWRAGIATIVLDHVVKNAEARGKYAIGSERKTGGADVHLGFEAITPIRRGGTGHYKIVTHKDRGGFLKRGKLADVHISSDPDTHALDCKFTAAVETDEEHPFRPTFLMEKVSRYLERQLEPVTIGDVKEVVTGKASAVVEAVDVLVNEGFVSEQKGSRGARMLESVNAYRQDEETAPDPFPTHSQPFPEPAETTHSPFPSLEGTGEDGVRRERELIPKDDIPF